MVFNNIRIIKSLLNVQKGNLKHFFAKKVKDPLVISLVSAFLRVFLSHRFIFEIVYPYLKRKRKIRYINEFWIIRIGFPKQKNYLPFFNFDSHISNSSLCCNLKKLPFKRNSCQIITIKHFFHYFKNEKFQKILRSFNNRLIPGGSLKIQIEFQKNEVKIERLMTDLKKSNFFIEKVDKSNINIYKSIIITAIKQLRRKDHVIKKNVKKLNDIIEIIKQNQEIIKNKTNILLIGKNSDIFDEALTQYGLKTHHIKSFENLLKIPENSINFALVADFFEFINFKEYMRIFDEIKRILESNADVFIIVPDKKNYYSRNTAHIFDKGILVRILDENNLSIQSITLSSSLKMLQTHLKNQPSFPIEKNNIKVLLLGVYSMRYTFLTNARWDSQARAFEKLGYQTNIIDLEDESNSYIIKVIKEYNPDILWVGGKVGGAFLKDNADFFMKNKYKIIYWLWDIIKPRYFDYNKIIDYMFITSKGEIPLYKKTYNLEKVYYMPVAIMPEIICRNKFIKEKFEVGFGGQLSLKNRFYIERTKTINYIKKHYNVRIIKNIFNYMSEEYSQCKIIFAGDPYFKDLELYASNRPYIAMASGCCIITNYFKGLEKLAVNEKHLLWYNNKSELKSLLDKYLSNQELREEIKRNAAELAREKHNYISRITNMLDIINGKTEKFYGFI